MMPAGLKRAAAFGAVVLGFFMALLDSTIVNVALPEMTKYFDAQMDHMSWVVNGYNLAFAVFLVTASRLADQLGRKKLFLIGVILFVLFSVLAGLSGSLPLLILFRVLQGLSAAIVVPVTIPLAMELFPPRLHGVIIGVWGGIAGLAAASGPTLGGLLTDAMGWQAVFYVNVPIGILCVALSIILLRESHDPSAGQGMDWAGMLLLTLAMLALTYGLIQANDWGWSSTRVLGLLGSALVLGSGFVLVERRAREPMLPLWLFRISTFNWACLTLLMIGAGIMMASFLMSYFLTNLMGKTVLQAGLIISAMPLASMIVSASVGALTNKYGSRIFVAAGMTVLAGSLYSYGELNPESDIVSIIGRLALTGIGMGLSMAPVMGSVIRNVPPEKVGIASGITNMTRALGSVIGVALIVAVLNSSAAHYSAEAGSEVIMLVKQDPQLQSEQKLLLAGMLQEQRESSGAEGLLLRLEEVKKKDAALEGVVLRIEETIRRASTASFSRTFHIGGLVMMAGIVFGFLSDRKRGQRNRPTSQAR
jgi:EmrB/QacA subfamily drug resistance transporter